MILNVFVAEGKLIGFDEGIIVIFVEFVNWPTFFGSRSYRFSINYFFRSVLLKLIQRNGIFRLHVSLGRLTRDLFRFFLFLDLLGVDFMTVFDSFFHSLFLVLGGLIFRIILFIFLRLFLRFRIRRRWDRAGLFLRETWVKSFVNIFLRIRQSLLLKRFLNVLWLLDDGEMLLFGRLLHMLNENYKW